MKKSYSNLRSLLFVCAVFLLSNFYSFSAFSQCNPAANDPSFNPLDEGFGNGDGFFPRQVNKIVSLPNGQILVAGGVLLYNYQFSPAVVRLNSDGSRDNSFMNLTNYNVLDMVVQQDGKVLIYGALLTNNPNSAIVARLNSDGSLDNTFNFGYSGTVDINKIGSIAIQTNGKILISGYFNINNNIYHLIRLNSNGSIDNNFFKPIFPNSSFTRVSKIIVQDDDKILIGGGFSTCNGIDKENIVRLKSNGVLDTAFNLLSTVPNNYIEEMVLQNDNKIIIGGSFTQYNGVPVNKIARLNENGTLDSSFENQIEILGQIPVRKMDINLQIDGKILISGYFKYFNEIPSKNLIRLNTNGSVDISFKVSWANQSFSPQVIALPNGKVLTNLEMGNMGINRLNSDGSFDSSFNTSYGFNGDVEMIKRTQNNKMFVLGQFYKYNNKATKRVTRIYNDGTIDTTFNLQEDGLEALFPQQDVEHEICQMEVDSNGKVLLAGVFNSNILNNLSKQKIVRFNTNGMIDSTFNSSLSQEIFNKIENLIVQPDGKAIICGAGQNINISPTGFGLIRLNTNGSIDNSFISEPFGLVHKIAQQLDGKIIVVGSFSTYNGMNTGNIVRLLPNGNLDPTFSNDLDEVLAVSAITILDNGDILLAGLFDSNGTSVKAIKKINSSGVTDTNFNVLFSGASISPNIISFGLSEATIKDLESQADGKIWVGGHFDRIAGVERKNLARLNTDGSIDTTLISNNISPNHIVNEIITYSNDSIIIAGGFTSYDGVGRNRIAKLVNSVPHINNTTPINQQYGVCVNNSTVLQATGQGTVYWYNDSTSIAPIHEGNNFTTPILIADSTYFYAKDSLYCGSSDRLEILVTTSETLNAVSQTNYTAYLDNVGNIEVDAILLDSISSAGCGNTIASYLFDDTGLATRLFSCADTNTVHNVVLRVTDSNGNVEISPTIIHVKDTIRPVATSRILPVVFNYTNQATILARDFITSLSDNCTDSTNINVVFDHTGLDSLRLYCGNSSVRNLNLRITDRAGNQVIQSVTINPSATNYDFNVNIFSNPLRPNIVSTITVYANNYSCAPKSEELKVTLPSNVTYNSASITPDRIVGNDLFWNVTDLSFDRNFVVLIRITPNIGDEVCFTGHITPETSDIATRNNLKSYCFPIVNSYDPNDKQVYPQGICDEKFTKRSDLPLTYTIRFQNTGNAPALNVRIADSLSNKLNRRSLRVVGSSHPMVVDTTANNNVINFRFDNINLPDSLSNPEGSQGYVIFELSEIAAHTDTSRISNKSYIYFDTNAPIITNTVKNTIVNTLPLCNPAGGGSNPPIADCQLPTNLRTEILSSTRVKLLWITPTNTNAINYEILRNGQRLNTVPASNLFYIDSTLTANTQYNYSIKAICGNNTATSNSVQVRTLPATPILLSVVAACKGEKGRINVQSAGAVYRVYSSQTSTTPLFETNNASIETPILSDSITFYISVVINGQESQRLKAVVPIKEVFSASIEQGSLLESCATEFTLSAQNVAGATYTWFRENVQVGTERTLTTTFEARYKVRVIKNGCSDESELTTTRFVSAPTAKIKQGNSVSFCGSGTLNVQDTSSNVVYEWILNGNVIKTGTSASVSESGTYTLKASQPSCESSVTIAVTITTAPANVTLTADKTAICTNAETSLSVTTGTGFTYKWFRNNTAISNSSATLSTSEIGTYKVEITTAEGCKVTTSETEITRLVVNQAILRVNTESGKDKTIDVTSQDAIESVKWFKDGVEIPAFANQNLITPTQTGNYKAKVVYETGCSFETAEKTFTVGGITGIEEESAKIFTIYPNPNNGSFKVEFATTTNQKTRLTLVDALGRIIHSQEIAMNEKTTAINLPKISAGVYVVQIISEGKVYTKQLIIQ